MKVKEESEKAGLKPNIQKTNIMAYGPVTSWEIDGETMSDFILGGSRVTANLKNTCSLKAKDQPRQNIKKQRHYFANKGLSSQSYGFPSSHVWMWELDNEESWALKNCCFWTVMLEKTLESPLKSKEIQPVHPKGNQSWIFTERTDAYAETPILRPHDAKSWLTRKDPDAWRKD